MGMSVVKTNVALSTLPHAKGAFIGLRDQVNNHVPTLDEVRKQGLEIVEWDATYVVLFGQNVHS